MFPPRIEWIRFRKVGEYFHAQVAIDGKLSMPVEVHASERSRYRTDDDFRSYIVNQSISLIQLYGDVRENKIETPEMEAA